MAIKAPKSLRQVQGMSVAGKTRAGLGQDGASGVGMAAVAGLSALIFMPAQAQAQPAAQLETVRVQDTAIDPNPNAEVGVPYKAKTSGDERRTRPLAETPQTITVLTKSQIDDSGYTDLSRILDAQPGVTVGTGENGNAFGDRYIIRGQEARSDVFVDGLRDPGMTIRESFAVDQIEITKGPSSSFAGRGSSGGAINAITKQATPFLDFAKIQAAVGSDRHTRVAADVNKAFSDTFAVRANGLYAYENAPDRAPSDRERKGGTISAFYSPSDALDITLDYYGLRAKDNADLGGYLSGGVPFKDVPVYAQAEDFMSSHVDTFTGRIRYTFNDRVRLTSLTRYGTSDNGYVVTGARGATTSAAGPGGAYSTATVSTHQGWQDVSYFANQENLFVKANLFGLENELVFGFEHTDHKVKNGVYRVTNAGAFNCSTAATGALNAYCIIAPGGGAVAGVNSLLKRQIVRGEWDIDWAVKTNAAYVMNTVDLTPALTLFGGLRMDHFKFRLETQNTNTLVRALYGYSDTLWNGHAGVTYKLGGGGVLYASVASAADINGGESDVGTSSGYGGTVIFNGSVAGAKPERSVNFELGTKWNIFNETLLLTAAVFQATKSDVMEGADYAAVGTFNTGKNRVQGLEFGATGAVTDRLSVQAGVSFMESEVLASVTPANVGRALANFAKNSAVIQAKYQISDSFSFGGAVKYESERYGGQPDTAAPVNATTGAYSQIVPAYTVADLFATYRFNPNLELRANISNVANTDYYLAVYRSGAFLYKGDGRAYRLTLTYDF
jgi:catecholate siderophore receptor